MLLAFNGIIPPNDWYHKPELQDNHSYTVAMLLADNKIIPPKQWQHNASLKNHHNETVAAILMNNGILPPKEWEYIIDSYTLYYSSSDEILLKINM